MRAFLLFFVFLLLTPPGARASSVLPLSLDQLTDQAGTIFVGRCEGQESLLDEQGLPATYVRFEVGQGLKGFDGVRDRSTLLIKQYGDHRQGLKVAEGQSAVVAPKTMSLGASAYRIGAEYLLFLYPESDLGFTSPVGGGQGRFEIVTDRAAAGKLVVNPLNNRFLKTFREGPAALSEVADGIRSRLSKAAP